MVKAPACNAEDQDWSLGQEDPLEKAVATLSSTLAWKIPRMGCNKESDTTERLHFHFHFHVHGHWGLSIQKTLGRDTKGNHRDPGDSIIRNSEAAGMNWIATRTFRNRSYGSVHMHWGENGIHNRKEWVLGREGMVYMCAHICVCVCVCVCVHVEKVGAAFPPWVVSKQPFLSFHLSPFKPIFSAFFYSQTILEKLRQPQMRFHGRMCRGGVCCSICSFSLIPISSHTCSPSFPLRHLPFKTYSKISKYSIFILG